MSYKTTYISVTLFQFPFMNVRGQHSELMSRSLLDKNHVYLNTLCYVVLFSFSLDKILAAMTIAAERNNKERFAPIVEGLENHEAQQLQVSVLPFPRNKESEKVSSPPAASLCFLHVTIHRTLYFRDIHVHSLLDKIYTETFLFALKRMIKQQNFSVAT